MAARALPPKTATTASEPVNLDLDLDLEHAANTITPSASSRNTPRGSPSKPATPSLRHSFDIDDPPAPPWHHRAKKRLPSPITRCARETATWIRGLPSPRLQRITPFLPHWQRLPVRVLARLPRWARVGLYAAACVLWVVLFGVVTSRHGLPADIGGVGAPVRLACVNSLWASPQACGVDGRNCLPFDGSSLAFSCPAGCARAQVLNPRAIGKQVVNYRSLVVGGAEEGVYRGDSFICGAAIHAGVIGNGKGGCGVVSLVGEQSGFGAVERNGIESIGVDARFPMSFLFNQTSAVVSASETCQDPRWNLLMLSTVFTALFGLFTTSPATFFAPVFTILFFQIAMASDPPSYATYASLASTTLGRFLPAAFVAALFYRFSVRNTLRNCTAQVEKTVLWVGGAWVGALGNYTFERIPIQRLTGHDIRQQPGAMTALVIIILVLFAIILYQCHCLRLERRLPRYLALYALLGLSLGILAAIPGLNLRIHHYILALVLLPGTALQTRVSLLCQGLLVGLFVNGIARWGFDSILQTAAALRGDAQLGSGIPALLAPVVNGSIISFAWERVLRGYDGVSVLVNDVERYRGTTGPLGGGGFVWNRTQAEEQEYFRFGFVRYLPFGGLAYSDFTRAGTWAGNGSWSGIPAGRT